MRVGERILVKDPERDSLPGHILIRRIDAEHLPQRFGRDDERNHGTGTVRGRGRALSAARDRERGTGYLV